jgi:hypothetical protein
VDPTVRSDEEVTHTDDRSSEQITYTSLIRRGTHTRSAVSDVGTGHGVTHFSGHPFSRGLNRLLREHGFDDFVEAQCAEFYAATMGRPSVLA